MAKYINNDEEIAQYIREGDAAGRLPLRIINAKKGANGWELSNLEVQKPNGQWLKSSFEFRGVTQAVGTASGEEVFTKNKNPRFRFQLSDLTPSQQYIIKYVDDHKEAILAKAIEDKEMPAAAPKGTGKKAEPQQYVFNEFLSESYIDPNTNAEVTRDSPVFSVDLSFDKAGYCTCLSDNSKPIYGADGKLEKFGAATYRGKALAKDTAGLFLTKGSIAHYCSSSIGFSVKCKTAEVSVKMRTFDAVVEHKPAENRKQQTYASIPIAAPSNDNYAAPADQDESSGSGEPAQPTGAETKIDDEEMKSLMGE